MNKKQVKKFVKQAIEEREYKIIFLDFQIKWFETEDGINAIGSERAKQTIDESKKQIEALQKEITFFKQYASK